jgi:hypothetical protein
MEAREVPLSECAQATRTPRHVKAESARRALRGTTILRTIKALRRPGLPLTVAEIGEFARCCARIVHYAKSDLRSTGKLRWKRAQYGLLYEIIAPTSKRRTVRRVRADGARAPP